MISVRRAQFAAGWLVLGFVLLLGFWARYAARAGRSFAIDRVLAGTRTGWLTAAAGVVQTAFFNDVGAAAVVIIAVALLARRRLHTAVRVVTLFVLAVGVTIATRALFQVARPPLTVQAVAAQRSPSYPSGHVAVAAALTAALVLASTGAARAVAGILGTLVTATVAYSRLYLGVHTLWDVLGAVLIVVGVSLVLRSVIAVRVPAPLRRYRS